MSDAFEEIENNFKAQVADIKRDLEQPEEPKPEIKQKPKYRIKVIEKAQDKRIYIPQYRLLIIWFSFEEKGKVVEFDNIMKAREYIRYRKKLKEYGKVRYIPYT